MQICLVAWIVTFAYITLHRGIGFYYYRRRCGDMGEFFACGPRGPCRPGDVPIRAGRPGKNAVAPSNENGRQVCR
jgi:hypothetical protein